MGVGKRDPGRKARNSAPYVLSLSRGQHVTHVMSRLPLNSPMRQGYQQPSFTGVETEALESRVMCPSNTAISRGASAWAWGGPREEEGWPPCGL